MSADIIVSELRSNSECYPKSVTPTANKNVSEMSKNSNY